VKRSTNEKGELLRQLSAIFATVVVTRNTAQFRFGAERAKPFVNAHLHCIVSNLNRISKMSRLPPPPGKIYADAHAFVIYYGPRAGVNNENK